MVEASTLYQPVSPAMIVPPTQPTDTVVGVSIAQPERPSFITHVTTDRFGNWYIRTSRGKRRRGEPIMVDHQMHIRWKEQQEGSSFSTAVLSSEHHTAGKNE